MDVGVVAGFLSNFDDDCTVHVDFEYNITVTDLGVSWVATLKTGWDGDDYYGPIVEWRYPFSEEEN